MSGLTATASAALEARLAHLAQMPADADAALSCFKSCLRAAWASLGSGGAAALLHRALHTTIPILPPPGASDSTSLEELLSDLDRALVNHHPEEMRVACFTLLGSLVELTRCERGEAGVQALLASLEHTVS